MSLLKTFTAFSKAERIFLVLAMLCGIFISMEYGITRPASNAIFISQYSTTYFPYVWLACVPLNFFVIFLYNRLLPIYGCFRIFLAICVFVILAQALSAFFILEVKYWSFCQYLWKDIYILLMFKQLWSLIHETIEKKQAKMIYGIIFGMGGVGAVIGSLISTHFSVVIGSTKLFLFSIPIYFLLIFFYLYTHRQSNIIHRKRSLEKQEFLLSNTGFHLFKKSRLLLFVALLVIFMQISIALVDYQFNLFLETNVLDLDLKTQYTGKLLGLINGITACFQFVGGIFIVHFFGLKNTHLMVPFFLAINALILLLYPTFGFASYSFVTVKVMDFSLFGIIREMLYTSMSREEKFRGKAIIDVFFYRTSKALASLFLLLAPIFFSHSLKHVIGMISFTVFLLWLIVVITMFRSYEKSESINIES